MKEYRFDEYVSGERIEVGDEILVAGEPSVILGVFPPGSVEAILRGEPSGCIDYKTLSGIRYVDPVATEEIVFVRRKPG